MTHGIDPTPSDREQDSDTRLNHDADRPLNEAYVEFESETSQAFRQLVQQTLAGSDFIDTEWVGEQLVLTERPRQED